LERTTKKMIDRKSGFELGDHRNEKFGMISFQGSEFGGIDMRNTSFGHVNFVQSKWEHIYFSNVHINMIQMGGTIFENVIRPNANESQLLEEPGTEGWVNVEPVVFKTSDLSTAVFDSCNLSEVELKNCNIDGLKIDGILIKDLIEKHKNVLMSTITSKVEQKDEVKIIAKKCVGLKNIFEGSFVKDTSQELAKISEEIPSWINRRVHYGIAPVSKLQDNPETHSYLIGIEVSDFTQVPDGYECLTIPSGKYAVIHKSPTINPGDVYGVWNKEWIKSDEGYTYEYFYESIEDYSKRTNGEDKDFEMDLCIPLK